MMEESGSKKVLLSVLGVAILVVAVVGISFAAFSFTNTSDENSIQTGTITMSYAEPENGISITDALPMADATGMALSEANEYFQFTVSTKASGTLEIPYEINVTPANDSLTENQVALASNQVKVYLSKAGGEQVTAPVLISGLPESTLRPGSYILATQTDSHTGSGADITTTYQLRMWVDNSVDISAEDWDSTKEHVYKLKVNVDSHVNPIGQ